MISFSAVCACCGGTIQCCNEKHSGYHLHRKGPAPAEPCKACTEAVSVANQLLSGVRARTLRAEELEQLLRASCCFSGWTVERGSPEARLPSPAPVAPVRMPHGITSAELREALIQAQPSRRHLCEGGEEFHDEPCTACFDASYARFEGIPVPAGHQGWRAEFERAGKPYARQRMEQLVTLATPDPVFGPRRDRPEMIPVPVLPPQKPWEKTRVIGLILIAWLVAIVFSVQFTGENSLSSSLLFLLSWPLVMWGWNANGRITERRRTERLLEQAREKQRRDTGQR